MTKWRNVLTSKVGCTVRSDFLPQNSLFNLGISVVLGNSGKKLLLTHA